MSNVSVLDTVERLTQAIDRVGAKVFAVIDHSGEAERQGLELRQTKVVIFGNPVAGTPLMVSTPLVALDLPLKVLVWSDDEGAVWMSFLSADWLGDRYQLAQEQLAVLGAVDGLTAKVAGT